MVYVDQLKTYCCLIFDLSCHMFADTLEELHLFAASIGLKRKWCQDTKYPHYDLTRNKREMALDNGAIETTTRRYLRKQKGSKCGH